MLNFNLIGYVIRFVTTLQTNRAIDIYLHHISETFSNWTEWSDLFRLF